jgi:S-methylmethionine-dependent homocysteine/selenocysteine methylase
VATLLERLATGRTVVMDGAMGTEIDRRGAPIDLSVWSARALESRHEVVREIHEDYVRAGAELQITNTFATARHVLEAAGLGDRFEELNRDAVELCREAIATAEGSGLERWIAGSNSTYAEASDRTNLPPLPTRRTNYFEQAELRQT